MSNNAHELSNRLLNALDSNYNVVDMQTVNEIISILEKFNITKELLETTRLGKHVNELRRKTADPTLARRAKVLVKRWRDLVIPAVASPAHTGSNRSSAERQVRRLGGTPLTSPALSRHVVSPAVPSPRPLSRPAWGGYESDSQDVILVDDDPPPPPHPSPFEGTLPIPISSHKPLTPTVKRPPSPDFLNDDKKAKRDKKPRKRRGHSRAGSGTEATALGALEPPAPPHTLHGLVPPHRPVPAHGPVPPHRPVPPHGPVPPHAWGARNGSGPERRRNGWRRDKQDSYAALVNRLPPAGAKKVKTTKELLEQIQSRGTGKAPSRPLSPHSPNSPHSPDVMLIEPDTCPVKVDSPLRNGSSEPKKPEPEPEPVVLPPLEDEREWAECTCGEPEGDPSDPAAGTVDPVPYTGDPCCPAAAHNVLRPLHVLALHNALLPGVNGTRAPPEPHRFAVRPPALPDQPGLFASVVPLYNYSDYADDYCVKNLSRIPLCSSLPWTEFAPAPPSPPPPPTPPPLRPYPIDPPEHPALEVKLEPDASSIDSADDAPADDVPETEPSIKPERERPTVEAEMVGIPILEPSERLKAPLLTVEDETQFGAEPKTTVEVVEQFASEPQEHRTVERTKEELDGRTLYALCETALRTVPYRYEQAAAAPVLALPPVPGGAATARAEADAGDALSEALDAAARDTRRDAMGRPARAAAFAEWHECARLGELIALPYVVID